MIADMHVHSTFSPDGISTMEEQCIAALEKGERIICFTDHVDYNVAEKNNGIIKDNSKANFIIEEYLIEIDRLRKKYPELKILKGIEFSEPHLFKKEFERYSQYPFDYILGSVHHCYLRKAKESQELILLQVELRMLKSLYLVKRNSIKFQSV
ncbi:MAG: PHP domain-containing protein [Oliverpabstia sp.]